MTIEDECPTSSQKLRPYIKTPYFQLVAIIAHDTWKDYRIEINSHSITLVI